MSRRRTKKPGRAMRLTLPGLDYVLAQAFGLRSALGMDSRDARSPRVGAIEVHATTPRSSYVLRVRARVIGRGCRVVAPPEVGVRIIGRTDVIAAVDESTRVGHPGRVKEHTWRNAVEVASRGEGGVHRPVVLRVRCLGPEIRFYGITTAAVITPLLLDGDPCEVGA